MKQIILELDNRCARDLERVAPAKKRLRAEFIRKAIRMAIDLALDRTTEAAYQKSPLSGGFAPSDLQDWDEQNLLAQKPRGRPRSKMRRRRSGAKKAA